MTEARFWKYALLFVVATVALVLISHIWHVLIPFILGLVIAYLAHPLTDRFVAMGMRRDRVVIVLYIAMVAATVLLALIFLPILYREIQVAIQKLPVYATIFDDAVVRMNEEIRRVLGKFIGKKADGFHIPFRADRLVEIMLNKIPENISNFAHIGIWLLIIPFVSFFGLSHGQQWIDDIFDLTPSEYVESLLGLLTEVNATLGAYIRGQLLDALCVGFLTMGGLWLVGFNGVVLLGVITGVLNVVPFLAPVVGGALALLIGYFQGMSLTALVGVVCVFILIRLIDDFLLMPFVVGGVIHLHPVLMLFAILAGFEVGGFLGLVFAIPVMAVAKVILSSALLNRRAARLFQNQKMVS